MNIVMLKGSLARAPEVRELATGEQVVGYEVIVLREGERAETVPVVRNGSAAVARGNGGAEWTGMLARCPRRLHSSFAG